MNKRNETRKKRYEVYRKLGYDSKTASALSNRSLDVSALEISKRTGKLKQNTKTKQFVENERINWERKKSIDKHQDRIVQEVINDTSYTRHGMLVKDKRYKGETGKIVSIIKNENKLTTNQAYYFFYMMSQNGWTYKETKIQLLSNKEFEMYDKNKRMR